MNMNAATAAAILGMMCSLNRRRRGQTVCG